jgi:hypothetical protein
VVDKLKKYREYLIEKHNAEFPKFAKDAVHTAPILALLQDPGNSGAEKGKKVCSIDNKDTTSINQREVIKKVNRNKIVFWNFFASFDIGKNFGIESQVRWAKEIEKLIDIMREDLQVVVVCGEKAWKGMRFVKLDKNIALIAAPHPSGRGLSQPGAKDRLKDAWKQALDIIKEI